MVFQQQLAVLYGFNNGLIGPCVSYMENLTGDCGVNPEHIFSAI